MPVPDRSKAVWHWRLWKRSARGTGGALGGLTSAPGSACCQARPVEAQEASRGAAQAEGDETIVLPTDEQVEEFRESKAGELCLAYIGVMMEKIAHRRRAEEEERRRVEELRAVEVEAEEKKVEYEDLFAEDDDEEEEEEKPTLPVITYPTDNLTRACVNLKERDTREEVCFEEYRQWSDAQNRKNSLSLIVRDKLNQTFTVRAAPFDLVSDVMDRCKMIVENPSKMWVLSHDGSRMSLGLRMIDHNIMNNACLKIWEEEEWFEYDIVHKAARNGGVVEGGHLHRHRWRGLDGQSVGSFRPLAIRAPPYSTNPPPPGY